MIEKIDKLLLLEEINTDYWKNNCFTTTINKKMMVRIVKNISHFPSCLSKSNFSFDSASNSIENKHVEINTRKLGKR